jgi:hypothetical protein
MLVSWPCVRRKHVSTVCVCVTMIWPFIECQAAATYLGLPPLPPDVLVYDSGGRIADYLGAPLY